jgi:hypothetical protein
LGLLVTWVWNFQELVVGLLVAWAWNFQEFVVGLLVAWAWSFQEFVAATAKVSGAPSRWIFLCMESHAAGPPDVVSAMVPPPSPPSPPLQVVVHMLVLVCVLHQSRFHKIGQQLVGILHQGWFQQLDCHQ